MQDILTIAILIAATAPLAASIFSAFSPKTQVHGIEGYFLYDRKLDIDSFLKTTIGYSLQVASISLFFYWTFAYGIIGPLIVCAAWTSSYFLMASAIKRNWLNDFLGTSRADATIVTETIHGFIGERMKPASDRLKKISIVVVSLASIIGLGGTMMAEVDYSTVYFLQSLDITNAPQLLTLAVEIATVAFTVLYVLWGGYKSAVFTDRFQVPVAYVAFSVFTLGIVAASLTLKNSTGVAWLVATMLILFSVLLLRRRNLLKRALPKDNWDQLTTLLTFVPILVLGLVMLAYLAGTSSGGSIASLLPFLFPTNHQFAGFGAWGTVALIFANGVWQFIDISSLQRLQSLDKEEVREKLPDVIRTLRVTGVEAGIGWFLIAIAAIILRSAGFDGVTFLTVLRHSAFSFLIPVFIFTVVVYMLSTISGFISALSYISYFDIVPGVIRPSTADGADTDVAEDTRLLAARVTTLFVIIAIFVLYVLLRVIVPGDKISSVLYAIYAFQIAIMPSAIVALFFKNQKINPYAAILSVLAGISVAYWTATNPWAWQLFSCFGMDPVSWGVVPPLASAFISILVFAGVTILDKFLGGTSVAKS